MSTTHPTPLRHPRQTPLRGVLMVLAILAVVALIVILVSVAADGGWTVETA